MIVWYSIVLVDQRVEGVGVSVYMTYTQTECFRISYRPYAIIHLQVHTKCM